jgi:hypothetical protein
MPSASAQEKLAVRARHVATLRRRIVASILATFVLAWGVVAFDGSMGAESTSVASTGTTTSAADSTTSTDTHSDDSSSSRDDGSTMTTQQS